MATREELRAQARARTIPEVARLVRSRDFRSAFVQLTDSRQQTIISVLPDDTMGYVLDRLREAGGTAILVLLTELAYYIAVLLPASDARLAVAEEDDSITEVHVNSQVDMFFEYLTKRQTAVIRRVAAKLVDHSPLQPA